jgi:hypothetical protein
MAEVRADYHVAPLGLAPYRGVNYYNHDGPTGLEVESGGQYLIARVIEHYRG